MSKLLYTFAAPIYFFVKPDIPWPNNFSTSFLDEKIHGGQWSTVAIVIILGFFKSDELVLLKKKKSIFLFS